MVGSWMRRTAMATAIAVASMLWPQAAEEAADEAARALAAEAAGRAPRAHAAEQATLADAAGRAHAAEQATLAYAAGKAFATNAAGQPGAASGGTAMAYATAGAGAARDSGGGVPAPTASGAFADGSAGGIADAGLVAGAAPAPLASSASAEPAPLASPKGVDGAAAPPSLTPAETFVRLKSGDRTGGMPGRDDRYETPERPTVYLTFDDGPTKRTPEVLDILREHEVQATFFVLGELAERQEDTIRRIVREGHALGNHTYNHRYDELYGSFETFWAQVEKTEDALARITGKRTSLLRAPGGTARNFDAFYFYYLESAGYSVFDWTVDSGDSKRRGVPASEIVANVKRAKLSHEMNVLLHDGAGHGETVKALPDIIRYFKEKGYRFAPLSERVRPVAFAADNDRWARSISEAEHERLSALMQSAFERRQEDAAGGADPSVDVRPRARAAAALTVKERAETAERWVALRDWGTSYGAVSWDASSETATLATEDASIRFDVRSGKAIRSEAGRPDEVLALPFRLVGDRLYVEAEAIASFEAPRPSRSEAKTGEPEKQPGEPKKQPSEPRAESDKSALQPGKSALQPGKTAPQPGRSGPLSAARAPSGDPPGAASP